MYNLVIHICIYHHLPWFDIVSHLASTHQYLSCEQWILVGCIQPACTNLNVVQCCAQPWRGPNHCAGPRPKNRNCGTARNEQEQLWNMHGRIRLWTWFIYGKWLATDGDSIVSNILGWLPNRMVNMVLSLVSLPASKTTPLGVSKETQLQLGETQQVVNMLNCGKWWAPEKYTEWIHNDPYYVDKFMINQE